MADLSGAFSDFCFLFHWDHFVYLDDFVFLERIKLVVGFGWGSRFAVNRSDLLTIEHGIIWAFRSFGV